MNRRGMLDAVVAGAGVVGAATALVLIGQAIFSKPAGIPSAKLERALKTLDAKTCTAIEAELAKP